MSLIYNALNKLEKKIENGTPNMLGNLGADQYVLSSKSSGMPAWVKILLGLCLLGIVSGWLATTVLKDRLQTLQDSMKSRNAAVPALASASAQGNAVAVKGTENIPATPMPDEFAQAEKQERSSLENTEAKLAAEKHELRASGSEQAEKNQQEVAAADANTEPATTIPENEISHVEIKIESPLTPVMSAQDKSGKLAYDKKPGKQENIGSAKLPKTARAEKSSDANTAKSNGVVMRDENMQAQEISRLTQSIKQAISAGKKAEADDMLAQLEKRLEPESLTLLHLKAWRQMQGGDSLQAINLYQQITERNPEDETAAINLALLLWRAGQQAEARKVINAIAERKPDSEMVQSYSRQFGVQK